MGRSCVEAQITAHHAALGNSEGRKAWCGFPKTLEYEKLVRFLYNCAATLRAPTFATSSSSSASRSPNRIHTRSTARAKRLT